MNNLKHLFCIVPMILASRCFAESLYLTSPVPLPPEDDRFVFIAPYFPELKTNISVSISKGAWNKDLPAPTCTPACTSDGKPPTPDNKNAAPSDPTCPDSGILTGNDGIVSCTPTGFPGCRLHPDAPSGSKPGYATCISASSGNYGPPVLSISVSPVPVSRRGFLYFTKNPFFSDSANVSISSDGLLSSSDSSSTQQITAILTELAQTAGIFGGNLFVNEALHHLSSNEQDQRDRRQCVKVVNDLAKNIPFYKSHDIVGTQRKYYNLYCDNCRSKENSTSITMRLDAPPAAADERVTLSMLR